MPYLLIAFSVPKRLEVSPVSLKSLVELKIDNNGQRPTKRSRIEQNGKASEPTIDLMSQVEELGGVFSVTLDL